MHTVIDLKEIAAELEHHFRKSDGPKYTGQCAHCDAEVTQLENECYNCSTPVVWLNSKTWEHLYGNGKLRLAELEQVEPTSFSGKVLCQDCHVFGFANQKEETDWAKAERWFGQAEMASIIQYATKNQRGRGAMAHALAIARKKLRENPKPKSREEKPLGTTVM